MSTPTANPAPAEPVAGQHAFEGACAPEGSQAYSGCHTFSVGVFQWMEKSGRRGVKKGAVKVRVKGYVSDPQAVYAKAREIVAALDAGTYRGPASVNASR